MAHIVNPFRPPEGSEWEWVQPITFESMRRARAQAQAEGTASVSLLSAQFEADRDYVPEDFTATANLTRSVRDIFPDKPPLPFVGDILARLAAESSAEWLIYTNVDIAVQPHFYTEIARLILENELDGCIVNRRGIPGHYRHIEELDAMYAEQGKPHPGFDCFVFHRRLAPLFETADVCVGIPFIGIITAQNMFAHCEKFALYEDLHLTFHIGEDVFKDRDKELLTHNRREFRKAINRLWPVLDNKKFPYGNKTFIRRMLKWGLHPSIPIRLAFQLEWKRMTGKSGTAQSSEKG